MMFYIKPAASKYIDLWIYPLLTPTYELLSTIGGDY